MMVEHGSLLLLGGAGRHTSRIPANQESGGCDLDKDTQFLLRHVRTSESRVSSGAKVYCLGGLFPTKLANSTSKNCSLAIFRIEEEQLLYDVNLAYDVSC